jgi:hypothetical protein
VSRPLGRTAFPTADRVTNFVRDLFGRFHDLPGVGAIAHFDQRVAFFTLRDPRYMLRVHQDCFLLPLLRSRDCRYQLHW